MDMDAYFAMIEERTDTAYEIAEAARSQDKDPEPKIDIPVAKDLAAKAEGLISASMFPELEGSGVRDRIRELEEEYGKNDERVALEIGKEIAEERFYEFDELVNAVDAGLRVGLAYMTGGIVTAPLEGIADVEIKDNDDGSEYLAVHYAGPIRSAGGTASALSVLLADYIRKNVGLERYKPRDDELDRYAVEVEDYYTRVTKKQYTPERKETRFIAEHVPIEVTGTPTEQIEVSSYKDLPRIHTNRIRGGMCLVYLDGLPLKASKIKKRIKNYGEEFGLEHWSWIEEYIDLQHEIHSSGDEDDDEDENEEEQEQEYEPSDKYLGSLTAGRPIFSDPGATGGFRLRYGRSRNAGIAAYSFHPATMVICDRFMAIGTQLKVEYPGKATVANPCDAIAGPVVRLDNGDVVQVETKEEADELLDRVDEILFLGDMLVPFGEFLENGKDLLPSPFVEEWWAEAVKEADQSALDRDLSTYTERPFETPAFQEAIALSKKLDVPLHPAHTFYWDLLSMEQLETLSEAIDEAGWERGSELMLDEEIKPILEDLYLPHTVEDGMPVIDPERASVLVSSLDTDISAFDTPLEAVGDALGVDVKEQAPIFLGSRMGRPEKAERRYLKGKPRLLFPCGKEEGGRMRNLMKSYRDHGSVNEEIIHHTCDDCGRTVHFSYCPYCGGDTTSIRICPDCSTETEDETCPNCGTETSQKARTDIPVKELVNIAKRDLESVDELPELLKSPRAVTGKLRHVEPIEKGLLRKQHDLYINKDGTARYDSTDLSLTHFKPREIGTDVETLRELGYEHDIDGEPLEDPGQVCRLKPQDIVISKNDMNYAGSRYLSDVAGFVDDLLEEFYGLDPYYDLDDEYDLVGELVIGLAPHTSGGIIGRIIGFTDAKGTYAHPYWHTAKRRNCLPGDARVRLADGSSKTLADLYREADGETSVDRLGTRTRDLEEEVLSVDDRETTINEAITVYKTPAQQFKLEITTESGRVMTVFPDHRIRTADGTVRARSLEEGDELMTPASIDTDIDDRDTIDLTELFDNRDDVMVRGYDGLATAIEDAGGLSAAAEQAGVTKKQLDNYRRRQSVPLDAVLSLAEPDQLPDDANLGIKRDAVKVPTQIEIDTEFMRLLGFYLAEGYTRKSERDDEQFYQVCFAFGEEELRDRMIDCIETVFDMTPSVGDHVITISSRIIYELFEYLDAGEGAHSKRVPEMCMSLPEEKIAPMLAGYFAGDGSVEQGRLHVQADSVSRELLEDIDLLLKRFGIFTRLETQEREAGGILIEKYGEEHYQDRTFVSHKLHIRSTHARRFCEEIGFALDRKQQALAADCELERASREVTDQDMVLDPVSSIELQEAEEEYMYDIQVKGTHTFLTDDNLVSNNCDGDEDSVILLMDALLNFSRQFLPDARGSRTMDAPLILSTVLNPDEVDDESWNVDIQDRYSTAFYEATQSFTSPGDAPVRVAEDAIEDGDPFAFSYTHPSTDLEAAPVESSYVSLGEMAEKVQAQLGLGRRIRAVDHDAVAELLLRKHFLPDIKGNLRSFSDQELRCVDCNEKYRRAPLQGRCTACGGDLLLTIHEGTIRKYLEPSEEIADNFAISTYNRQQIKILKKQIQSLFGKADRQSSLGQFTAGE